MNVWACSYSCFSQAYILLFENDSVINNWSQYTETGGGYSLGDIPSEIDLAAGSYTLVYGNYGYNMSIYDGMGVDEAVSQFSTNSNSNSNEHFSFQMELTAYDGSCDYPGCTDPTAFNFNIDAAIDDGSCHYPTDLGSLECGVTLSTGLDTISAHGYETYESPQSFEAYSFTLDSSSNVEISYDMNVWDCSWSCSSQAYILLFENDSLINNWSNFQDTGGYIEGDIPTEIDLATGSYTLVYGNYGYNMSIYDGMGVDEAVSQFSTNSNSNEHFSFQMELIVFDCSFDYPGCTDSIAFNFNPLATADDGSCIITDLGTIDCDYSLSLVGLNNNTFFSFSLNSTSTINFNTQYSDYDTFLSLFDSDSILITSNDDSQYGLQSNVDISLNPGSYTLLLTNCCNDWMSIEEATDNINDSEYGTGILNITVNNDEPCFDPIYGCTYDWADNYSELANTDDGSCYLSGCIYEWAINYDSLATVDDGSCINDIYGCTSELSDNYDSLATVDNGSCFRYGCLSYWADNYDDLATEDDGSCFKLGCMYTYASNYDSEATQDDGLCIYTCTPPSYWEYSTTDVNHTVMILEDFLTDINGFPLASGSLIGVFYPDENGDMQCAGSTIFVGETTFIAVMGDDQTTEELDGFPTGQELSLMVWDTESCQEYQVNGSFEGSSSFNPNDITILTSIATNSLCQLMDIPSGWSMFSTYMIADDMDMTTVLFPMVENLIMVKDNDGTAYLPEFSFNGIGDFQVGQGYQIKTATDVSFEICGSYALPEDHPIALSQGWNLIGYLRTQSSDAIAVLSDISDAENLIILKDYDGVPYLPEFNFNGIGDMHPGEGYQLKVYESDTLEYLSNDASYRFSSHEVIDNKSSHFQRVSNTDQNMTVVIEDASWGVIPSLGSEIAAYNKEGTLVGSALYTSPVTVLTVWGDDAMTSIKEGMSLDENVSFKLWDTETTQEFEVVKWIAGSSSYQKDVINVASSIIATLIESSNTESTRVLVKIVNVLGQEVDLVDNTLKGVVLFEVYDDGSVELKVH